MEMIAVKIKISSGATEDAFNVKGRRHEAEAFEIYVGQQMAQANMHMHLHHCSRQ